MIEFKVRPAHGEPYTVTATSRDVFVFEKVSRGRTMSHFKIDLRMEDMYRLAHIASKRQQLFAGSLDEFAEACDLEFEDDDDLDPTQPEASREA